MKQEKQIGVRVGLPAFFALEVEDVYKHAPGAHRALAFPDFLGFLIGLGLEAYRKTGEPGKTSGEPDHAEDETYNFTPLYLTRERKIIEEAMGRRPGGGREPITSGAVRPSVIK
jgi:hypothetical protein